MQLDRHKKLVVDAPPSFKCVKHMRLFLKRSWVLFSLCIILVVAPQASVAEPSEDTLKVSEVFEKLRAEPEQLRMLLRKMPKGGDLHNHLAGSPYVEEYLEWASTREFCVNTREGSIVPPPCNGANLAPAANLSRRDPVLYGELVEAMSMKDFDLNNGEGISGHDQFFSTFGRFGPIAAAETGKSIVSVMRAAARDNVTYLEIIHNPVSTDEFTFQTEDPDFNSDDLEAAFERFLPLIPDLVSKGISQMDVAEKEANDTLKCGQEEAEKACDVEVRYNSYGLRVLTPDKVFRQTALGFAIAQEDPRFFGVTLVAPEDDPNSLKDYKLHMRMVKFLSGKFPDARISLHAGELALGLVPSSALESNIEDAIKIAGSERIGHGTDISFEKYGLSTLDLMAEKGIAVEIALTSNDEILGITGQQHPINLYLSAGVPVVLATDDQGVLRTEMTQEYLRAAIEHGLDYPALKEISQNSLEYAFLPGESLWYGRKVGEKYSSSCTILEADECLKYIKTNPKARIQLLLEERFHLFEKEIVQRFSEQ